MDQVDSTNYPIGSVMMKLGSHLVLSHTQAALPACNALHCLRLSPLILDQLQPGAHYVPYSHPRCSLRSCQSCIITCIKSGQLFLRDWVWQASMLYLRRMCALSPEMEAVTMTSCLTLGFRPLGRHI